SHNAVGFVAAGREHEDGDVGLAANFLQHLKTVHARQHQIENDRLPFLLERSIATFRAGVGGADFVAHRFEIIPDEPAELAVIVDYQDTNFAGARDGRIRFVWNWSGHVVGLRVREGMLERRLEKSGNFYISLTIFRSDGTEALQRE